MRIIILALVIATIWKANIGSIVFILVAFLLESLSFFANAKLSKSKWNNKNNIYNQNEVYVIEKYPLFFKFPIASRIFSATFSGIQMSAFILVPWLLYGGLYVQAIIIGINYFIAGQLSVINNPKFFLHDNLEKEKIKDETIKKEFTVEMNSIDSALEKMHLNNVVQ